MFGVIIYLYTNKYESPTSLPSRDRVKGDNSLESELSFPNA